MPELFLNKINTEYKTGKYIIKVQNEPYKGFRIFKRIRFSDIDWAPFHFFSIIANNNVIMKDYESRNYFIMENIDYVDVYVSKYNINRPLIIGVKNAGDYIYYKWVDLVPNDKHGLLNLIKSFVPQFKLSNYLIDANDEINGKMTFRIDKIEPYNHIKLKIEVKERDFVIYTHEPRDPQFQYNESYILINNVLFNPKPSNKIDNKRCYNPKNRKIKNMCVYSRSRQWYPLLVKLVDSQTGDHYFYRRNKNTWIQIEFGNELQEFYDKLDEIEFRTHYSMNVLLNEKSFYRNDSFKNDIGSTNTVAKIDVSKRKDRQNIDKYEIFVHDLQEYSKCVHQPENILGKFIVLRFLIFNNEIEINGNEYYILYGKSNLYVYFYENDNVPLLFSYENKYYGPDSRDSYFDRWVEKTGLSDTNCYDSKLIGELDKINKMLNEVNIDKISDYGLDYNVELNDYDDEPGCFTKDCQIQCKENKNLELNSFDYTRIKVKSEKYGHFTKYTHTTKNTFYIGRISYKSKELSDVSCPVYSSTDVSVTVYYFDFNSENNQGYPLLLVCKINNALSYYHISNKYKIGSKDETLNFEKINDFSVGLRNFLEQTTRFEQVDGFNIELYNFLEHQNYFLNNVICFNIDQKLKYSCCSSEGKYCQNIVVQVTQVEIGENEALKNANYKTYGHRAVEYKDQQLKRPTLAEKEKIDVSKSRLDIKAKNLKIGSNIIRLTHTTDFKKDSLFEKHDVYVHFYGDDPRPLLVYCDNSAFAPEGIEKYTDNWSLVKDVDYSRRGDGNYRLGSVLYKLHEISYKLNPVDISQSGSYDIHKYFEKNIKINVSSDGFSKYKFYTHTASKNYRLGQLTYKKETIVDSSYPYKSYEIKKVIVYYYYFDKDNKYPVLIQLIYDNGIYNMYYLLSSSEQLTWTRTYKSYLQHSWKENYDGPIYKFLDKLLDEPEFKSVKEDILSEYIIKEFIANKYGNYHHFLSELKAKQRKNELGEIDFNELCKLVTRGDDIARCDSTSTNDSNNTYLFDLLETVEPGESADTSMINTSESSHSGIRRAGRSDSQAGYDDPNLNCSSPSVRGDDVRRCRSRNDFINNFLSKELATVERGDSSDIVKEIPPTINGPDIKVQEPTKPVDEYDNKVLLYQILGSLGALFAIGVCILLLYLFFKIYLKDMRPSL